MTNGICPPGTYFVKDWGDCNWICGWHCEPGTKPPTTTTCSGWDYITNFSECNPITAAYNWIKGSVNELAYAVLIVMIFYLIFRVVIARK